MSEAVYRQQMVFCRAGARCRTCREGRGHGPYWYRCEVVNGQTIRTYVGKHLPPGVSVVRGAETPTAFLRVFALGQFHIERRLRGQRWQAIPESAWSEQGARRILAYLLSVPGRKAHRVQVREALWPDLEEASADALLERGVEALRQVIEPSRRYQGSGFLLRHEGGWFALASQQELWVDSDAFEALAAAPTAEQFATAQALYGGDYLPEERTTAWAVARRQALRHHWIGLLLELVSHYLEQGDTSSAISLLDRLLAVDPTNEAAVQLLLIALGQEHRRVEAMHSYQRFRAVLREHGIWPTDETQQLYEALQRGEYQVFPRALAQHVAARLNSLAARAGMHKETAARGPAGPLPAVRSHQHALVGREDEWRALRALLESAEQAALSPPAGGSAIQPRCALLLGEEGIGKTRLAEELAQVAQSRGWMVVWGHAYARESSIPYRVWIEACHMALAQQRVQFNRVIARQVPVFQSLRVLLPELDELLPTITRGEMPAEQEQVRLWEAIRALLAASSESAPLLIVLDDLQWADSSSCELLTYLVRGLREQSVMIVGTCRESELPANHPLRHALADLHREQAVETLTIQRLTDEQIGNLVAHLPEPVVRDIQARAAGNPFFAEELAHVAGARSTLPHAPGSSNVVGPLGVESTPLPNTISAVLGLRLDRLSLACRRLLARASILGGSFEFNTILAMEAGGPNAGEDTILDLLEEALQAGMLTEEGSGTRITYHFWHPLLVSHLYDGLSAGRRASLHRHAAEVLRRAYQGREEEGATAIVYHLANGGAESPQIAYYAELAGDHSYALSAYPEAERHYRLAAQHIGTFPADVSPDERLRLANLLERLGECTRVQGNDQEARRYLEQALVLQNQHRLSVPSSDSQHEAQIEALLWCELGKTWFDTGDYEHAQHCYDHGEQVLREAGVVSGPAWASLRVEQSYIHWKQGQVEQALGLGTQALALFEEALGRQSGHSVPAFAATATRRTLAGNPVDLGRAHTLLAALAATMGKHTSALEHLNRALDLFDRYDRRREIAIVSCNLGDVYLRQAEYAAAEVALGRAFSIAKQLGMRATMAATTGNLGVLVWRRGELAEAEIWFKRGLALAEQINDPIFLSQLQTYMATVLLDQGRWDEARVSLRSALSIGRTLHVAPCIGLALVALGHLRIAQAVVVAEDQAGFSGTMGRALGSASARWLARAKASLHHAQALEGVEVETSIEGQLGLAEITLLLGDLEQARQQTIDVLQEAHHYEVPWLLAQAERLLGNIYCAQGEPEQAYTWFTQAIDIFRKHGMRLELARSLRSYSQALLQQGKVSETSFSQGLQYLQEAYQFFGECSARLDLQAVSQLLSRYASTEQSDAEHE